MEQTRNEAKRRSAEADRSTELLHGILPEQLFEGKGGTARIAMTGSADK
jgi:hypothetical protein